MSRFEIEEIIAQGETGIVYRGTDTKNHEPVAIRRFFPYGQNGGGLDAAEAASFRSAAEKLCFVEHPALRSIVAGDLDPIDGIPFIVTQWIEGVSLKTIIAGEVLDPALVIDLLRIALEVSIVLSHVLGEEAVWIETDVESIVLGTQDSERSFTFWICPFKWLGRDIESRTLSSIAELGEELAGWQNKLVSDQAGNGLGGWLKWIKANPETSLREARERLASCTGGAAPDRESTLVRRSTRPASTVMVKQPSSKTPLVIAALIVMIGAAGYFYLPKNTKLPTISPQYTEQTISEVITSAEKTPPVEKPRERQSQTRSEALSRANDLAEKLSQEAAENHDTQAALLQEQLQIMEERGGILSPDDVVLVESFPSGTDVKLSGTLRGIRLSSSGKTLYLNFSNPYDPNQINGIIRKSDYEDDFPGGGFTALIGKKILLTGKTFRESSKKKPFVKITSRSQISTP
ncbi:hypothetical protein ACFSSA_13630 [Luteolibacter algae]|uniref:Protein kinase domain-containing protein n=1 Tax=Luteolibacter algae TaxID=454151 RepID=A0ABW5DCH0_9BACT